MSATQKMAVWKNYHNHKIKFRKIWARYKNEETYHFQYRFGRAACLQFFYIDFFRFVFFTVSQCVVLCHLSVHSIHIKLSIVLVRYNVDGGRAGRGECNQGDVIHSTRALSEGIITIVGNADGSTHAMWGKLGRWSAYHPSNHDVEL